MRFYAETDSKYQALKQFEQCRAAFHNLGIEPEPETLKLEQNIKPGEITRSKNEFKAVPDKSLAPIAISAPHIKQLTFQNGVIKSARFLPDGETFFFSAAWNGEGSELRTMRLESGKVSNLGIHDAEVYCVSSAGQIAENLGRN